MTDNIKSKALLLRKKMAESSIQNFAAIYMKSHLVLEPSEAHREIYSDLDRSFSKRGMRYALAAPRNFGKSTMITLICVLYSICFSKERFIVIISDSADQARQILSNVKRELTANDLLKADFPDVCETAKPPKPPRWREDDIVTRNRIEVLALGSGQKIRGRRFGTSRPTAIFLDDIQNDENVRNIEQREKTRDWFTKAVLNAGSEETNIFFLGNLLHQACLLGEYIDPAKNLNWQKRIYKAILREPVNASLWEERSRIRMGQSSYEGQKGPEAANKFYEAHKEQMDQSTATLWPARWSYAVLRDMRENNPRTFASEMQNEPLDPSSLAFNVEALRLWTKDYPTKEHLIRAVGDKAEFYGACDPSTGTASGDYSAIVILLKDTASKAMYVLVADIGRWNDTELVKRIFDYQQIYRCLEFAYETNQFQRLLVNQIEEESRRRGVPLLLKEVKSTGNKQKRIEGLSSWVRNGTIQFDPAHRMLIEQMRDFPQGNHDDGPDALEMAVATACAGAGPAITDEQMQLLEELGRNRGRGLHLYDPRTGQGFHFPGEGF